MKAFTTIALFSILNVCCAQTAYELKVRDGRVWVLGASGLIRQHASISGDRWMQILAVFTDEAFVRHIAQPVVGTHTFHGDSIAFTPSFGFTEGETYHIVFRPDETIEKSLELTFSIPHKQTTPTIVEAIHPQADILPENMLRMYISFSGPMMPGEAYDHITLLTETGTPVDKAFLIIDQELWDPERTRFTLLFDPGRVKRGIKSNLDLGTPLQAGQKYRLVIDSSWRDAHGNLLASSYKKSFTVTEAERTKLSTAPWKMSVPLAGSREALLIHFDRPIDYALAMKSISVAGTRAGKVSGSANLTNSTLWQFKPDQPWIEDRYTIEVNPLMEDVAGNNFNNAFDIDLTKETRKNSSAPVLLSFQIRSGVD